MTASRNTTCPPHARRWHSLSGRREASRWNVINRAKCPAGTACAGDPADADRARCGAAPGSRQALGAPAWPWVCRPGRSWDRLPAITAAKAHGYRVVDEFYDVAVSGADPIAERRGFKAMLDRIATNGVRPQEARYGQVWWPPVISEGAAGRLWRWPSNCRRAGCRCGRYPAPLQPKAT